LLVWRKDSAAAAMSAPVVARLMGHWMKPSARCYRNFSAGLPYNNVRERDDCHAMNICVLTSFPMITPPLITHA
jgi:hypothetical protein